MNMKTQNKPSQRWKTLEVALLVGIAVFLFSGALSLRTQDALAEKVVRLHVLANSDSQEDQALKLQVRDRILKRAEELLASSADRAEAAALLENDLPELERLAAEEIAAAGYDYPVAVRLEETSFPTKEYDGFMLPAGRYLALRVLIGEAGGQNWWCVVFPPLCAAASADVPASALAAGLTEEQVGLITEENEGYVLKFKSVELWENLKERWNGWGSAS